MPAAVVTGVGNSRSSPLVADASHGKKLLSLDRNRVTRRCPTSDARS